MVTVRTSCDRCGEVTLLSGEVTLRQQRGAAQATVAFVCPLCGVREAVEIDQVNACLLRQAGVVCSFWIHPAELDEPHPAGPAFNVQDLMNLHVLLAREDWFDELLRAVE